MQDREPLLLESRDVLRREKFVGVDVRSSGVGFALTGVAEGLDLQARAILKIPQGLLTHGCYTTSRAFFPRAVDRRRHRAKPFLCRRIIGGAALRIEVLAGAHAVRASIAAADIHARAREEVEDRVVLKQALRLTIPRCELVESDRPSVLIEKSPVTDLAQFPHRS